MDKLKAVAAATQAWVMEHKKVSGAIALFLCGYILAKIL